MTDSLGVEVSMRGHGRGKRHQLTSAGRGSQRVVTRRFWFVVMAATLACSPSAVSRSGETPAPAASLQSTALAKAAKPLAAPSEVPARGRKLTEPEAVHLLARLTFGARRADLDHAATLTLDEWLDWQLTPGLINDEPTWRSLQAYQTALAPPAELKSLYRTGANTVDSEDVAAGVMRRSKRKVDYGRLIRDSQMVQLVRQTTSKRQLLEVMVDFWFNHFNVNARKRPATLLVGDYLERAIRPHALGRFEDLLLATARHPAMLVYLDNAQSTVRSPGKDSDTGAPRSGINENYARELLELHTLGVSGGYTQRDVTEVARLLTGWTLRNSRANDFGFAFDSRKHDRGEKVVLGKVYPPGRGEEEGVQLLKRLARHPATAQHLAQKLCIRFVADTPPPACIQEVSQVWRASGGDIARVLRAIAWSGEFWRTENRGRTIKTPNEFMVSALRVLNATLKPGPGLTRWARLLGQPGLVEPVPTGYPDQSQAWLTTTGMLARMNFASTLAKGRLGGVKVDLDTVLDASDDNGIVARVNQVVLAGAGTEQTLNVIRSRVAQERNRRAKRRVAVALALASPEFQRQ